MILYTVGDAISGNFLYIVSVLNNENNYKMRQIIVTYPVD